MFAFLTTLLPLPVIALLVGIVLRQGLNSNWADLLAAVPYVAGLGAAILAWRFRQGNMSLAGLAVVSTHALLEAMPPGLGPITSLYQGGALYLPLALLYLGWMAERGLFNQYGVARMFLVLMPAAAIYAYHSSGAAAPAWMHPLLLPEFLTSWSSFPDPAFLALLGGLIGLGELHRRRKSPLEVGSFAALLLAVAAMYDPEDRLNRGLYMTGAGIMLVVVLVQNGYRVAFHDELTGLPGRRALRSLNAGLSHTYAIAMADVDHFKKFNDTYGHDVGDQVLQRVASVVGAVGGGGRPFRYGGEEFTIVFPGKRAVEAIPYLEEVRRAMEATPFHIRSGGASGGEKPPSEEKRKAANKARGKESEAPQRGAAAAGGPPKTVTITISMGVAEVSQDAQTPEAVMKQADEALYRAKQKGRNQVSR